MNKDNKQFIKMLKKDTLIDIEFIDTFFKKFQIGDDLNFDIHEKDVADYLNIDLITLRKRLNNNYTNKDESYFEKADYIKVKTGKTSQVDYYLNYACFERIAMNGDTPESETVRLYFSKLREFITDNQYILVNHYKNMKN